MLAGSRIVWLRTNFHCIALQVGESEKTLAAAFARAIQSAPCVLFFDEVHINHGPIRAWHWL
jgi:SpoVK/Ycf46/Vps4 family AAA+-type ATPase